MLFILLGVLRVGLDCAFGVWRLCFSFFFFFFLHAFVRLRLLFMYCSMNSSRKVWLFYFFQPISAYRVLFMDLQISFFNNFFIKNGSHGTIYTFKNYFATVFFSFSFQFSAVSKRTLSRTCMFCGAWTNKYIINSKHTHYIYIYIYLLLGYYTK